MGADQVRHPSHGSDPLVQYLYGSTRNRSFSAMNARKLLLPLALGVAGLCLAVQLVITARGDEIDLVAYLLLGVVALYYLGFLILRHDELDQVRFARLVAHAVAYVVVNGSFQIHAAILAMANSDALRADDHLPIDGGWFGITFAMAGFWAIGFTIHAIASISHRGFEN